MIGGAIKVVVVQGDILLVPCDAIVNANGDLDHAGGVARVIAVAAGPKLLHACEALMRARKYVPIPETEAVATGSFALSERNSQILTVVHTVGPIYRTASFQQATIYQEYKRMVLAALSKGVECGEEHIAMPLVEGQRFGWPTEIAAKLLLEAIAQWAGSGNLCTCITLVDINEVRAAATASALASFAANGPDRDAARQGHRDPTSKAQVHVELVLTRVVEGDLWAG